MRKITKFFDDKGAEVEGDSPTAHKCVVQKVDSRGKLLDEQVFFKV